MSGQRRVSTHPTVRVAAAAVSLGLALSACGNIDLGGVTIGGTTTTTATATEQAAPTTAPPATTTTTEPPPPLDEVFSAIADRTAMTDQARAVLAGSEPHLVGRDTLSSTCTLDQELSVLGCYRDGQIAVLEVGDPRLDGMTETTTAHEMLHAAWVSIDEGERDRLSGLLQTAFEAVDDDELIERIAAYRRRDPTVIDNELHSILGTEVADLGPELDTYYQRWFTDRSVVVGLAETAQRTFTDLEDEVADLDVRLADLRSRIETEETDLAAERSAIQAEADRLDGLRADGAIEEYNAGVTPFNQRVDAYNAAVADHQTLVDQHNALVDERNGKASAYTDLVDQITTTAESMPE